MKTFITIDEDVSNIYINKYEFSPSINLKSKFSGSSLIGYFVFSVSFIYLFFFRFELLIKLFNQEPFYFIFFEIILLFILFFSIISFLISYLRKELVFTLFKNEREIIIYNESDHELYSIESDSKIILRSSAYIGNSSRSSYSLLIFQNNDYLIVVGGFSKSPDWIRTIGNYLSNSLFIPFEEEIVGKSEGNPDENLDLVQFP